MSTKRKKRLGWLKHRKNSTTHQYRVDAYSGVITGCMNPRCNLNQKTPDHRYSP